jgi:16S rRNA (cytosine1402-N4)-methyltransferase
MQYLKSVNEISLAAVFSQHADLPRSLTLAKRIKAMLPEYEEGDLLQAATDSVFRVKGPKRNSILARVFQAIRMQLNSEIGEIEKALKSAVDLLQIQGRLCVLTYHSVEDRMVKQTLASYERKCICPPEQVICSCGGDNRRLKKVYKKPLLPERSEIAVNSRARSAKLRVVEKIK